jgi:hypothetical protein
MKYTPDEKQIEQLLEAIPPAPGEGVRTRLASAPWTPRAVARRRVSLVASLVVLGLVVLTAATPGGRAWAQGLLSYFTRAGGDTLPAPTMPTMRWVEQTPGVVAPTLTPDPNSGAAQAAFGDQCGNFDDPHCSVAQIRGLVDFTVKELGAIPAGMYFVGATGGPGDAWLFYKAADNSRGVSVNEQPWTGSEEQVTWQVGASAVVESIQIGDITGEYVKGSFNMKAGDPNVVWDPNFPTQNLRWVQDGILFTVQIFDQSGQVDKAAFIALAASMTTEPVAAAQVPMPTSTPDANFFDPYTIWTLTPAEAGALAGFTVHEPAMLPEVLSLRGAIFNAENHMVQIFYADTYAWSMGGQNGLTLSQQPILPSGEYELRNFIVGTLEQYDQYYAWTVVGDTAVIQTVQIGEFTGQYVEGAWYSEKGNPMQWHNDPTVKILRWQVDGMAFELNYWGSDITMDEMIAIAVSIK